MPPNDPRAVIGDKALRCRAWWVEWPNIDATRFAGSDRFSMDRVARLTFGARVNRLVTEDLIHGDALRHSR
jgi:hypothetical protein